MIANLGRVIYMRITEPYTLFLRTLPSGKQVYYYQSRDSAGRRSSSRSTGCTSLSKAKRFCERLYNSGQFEQNSKIKFGAFTKNFCENDSENCKLGKVNGNDIKAETLRGYKKNLKCQLLPFFEFLQMDKITPQTIKEWVIWCSMDKGWSAKTINNAQGTLNIIFKSAIDKKLITVNPLQNIAFRKIQKKKRFLLTVDEIRAIYHQKWHSETQKKIFLVCAITGMRIGEVIALTNDDVEVNYLNVRHSFSDRFGLGTTKTGKCRYVPIPEGLNLKNDSSKWIFAKTKDEPERSHNVYNAFCRLLDKMGIDRAARGITIHTLRNFFISYLEGENVPHKKIMATVGHADESMTDWYTYWSPDMLKEVYTAQQKLYQIITGVRNENKLENKRR